MNRQILGLILIGIGGVLIALCIFFLSRSMSIIDYGEVYLGGIGCDSCPFTRESLLNYSLAFGALGGPIGVAGIWVLLAGFREKNKHQEQA